MYANLEVCYGERPVPVSANGSTKLYPIHVSAWQVEVTGTSVTISLDANEGQSSYYVENGTLTLDSSVYEFAIGADF